MDSNDRLYATFWLVIGFTICFVAWLVYLPGPKLECDEEAIKEMISEESGFTKMCMLKSQYVSACIDEVKELHCRRVD